MQTKIMQFFDRANTRIYSTNDGTINCTELTKQRIYNLIHDIVIK